ncbi:hypothetical protein GCM10025794_35900 [Massilia kyonggiensis]
MFADATKPIYNCQLEERVKIALLMENLFSKYISDIVKDSLGQDLLGQSTA